MNRVQRLALIVMVGSLLLAILIIGLFADTAEPRSRAPAARTVESVLVSPKQKMQAEMKAAARRAAGQELVGKLRAVKVPGLAVPISYANPPGLDDGTMATAAYWKGTIYDPDRVLTKSSRAHEVFHAMATKFSPEDLARLQRYMPKGVPRGEWNQGTGYSAGGLTSPSEVAADMYGALVTKVDPRRAWNGAYTEAGVPSRKKLLRFGLELERLGRKYGLASGYIEPTPAS